MRCVSAGTILRISAIGLLGLGIPAIPKEPAKAELVLKNLRGQRVRLSDLRGKVVVLNFWATWCGPCKAELPMLVEAEKKYSPKGVVFIGASLDEPKSQARVPEFLSAHHVTFPVWIGATGDDLDRLQMGPAVPATAFLDAEGRITLRISGQIREDELEQRLEWFTGSRASQPPPAFVSHLDAK